MGGYGGSPVLSRAVLGVVRESTCVVSVSISLAGVCYRYGLYGFHTRSGRYKGPRPRCDSQSTGNSDSNGANSVSDACYAYRHDASYLREYRKAIENLLLLGGSSRYNFGHVQRFTSLSGPNPRTRMGPCTSGAGRDQSAPSGVVCSIVSKFGYLGRIGWAFLSYGDGVLTLFSPCMRGGFCWSGTLGRGGLATRASAVDHSATYRARVATSRFRRGSGWHVGLSWFR